MGKIVKSPAPLEPSAKNAVFLAGGISNCSDWQTAVAERLASNTGAVVYNPRRDDFDMNAYEEISTQQIQWEYYALRMAQVNLFWFPPETLCPITLFELGSAMERLHPGALMVGCHPDYQRLFDVRVQMKLRMAMPVYTDLNELVAETEILLKSIDCRV
jgi:hypothetical protein